MYSRSREGAWIEIKVNGFENLPFRVAPARERGLKYGQAAKLLQVIAVAPARERGLK